MVRRPDWWEPWIPETCTEGHPFVPGKISSSWEQCPDCPGAQAGGHHGYFCGVIGCRAEPIRPPGHVGPGRDQR